MTGRILKIDQLKKAKVCRSTIALFAKNFGRSVLITEAWAIENAAMFDWSCAARNLLSNANLAEYEKRSDPYWEKYDKQCAPYRAEYESRRASYLAEYESQIALYRAEFVKRRAPFCSKDQEQFDAHREEYLKRRAPYWAEYKKQREPHWSECQLQCAAIFAKLYILEGE